uniref:(northern house mosquito) hypothetical protein n=1 Tax=Culex pipiens TaxID=7175 RepID=A0A8D8BC94_CULPI
MVRPQPLFAVHVHVHPRVEVVRVVPLVQLELQVLPAVLVQPANGLIGQNVNLVRYLVIVKVLLDFVHPVVRVGIVAHVLLITGIPHPVVLAVANLLVEALQDVLRYLRVVGLIGWVLEAKLEQHVRLNGLQRCLREHTPELAGWTVKLVLLKAGVATVRGLQIILRIVVPPMHAKLLVVQRLEVLRYVKVVIVLQNGFLHGSAGIAAVVSVTTRQQTKRALEQ